MSLSCLVCKMLAGGHCRQEKEGGAVPSCAIGLVKDVVLARAAALKVNFSRHNGLAHVLGLKV